MTAYRARTLTDRILTGFLIRMSYDIVYHLPHTRVPQHKPYHNQQHNPAPSTSAGYVLLYGPAFLNLAVAIVITL